MKKVRENQVNCILETRNQQKIRPVAVPKATKPENFTTGNNNLFSEPDDQAKTV